MFDREVLTINLKGFLMNLEIPKVMGILNVTPDSFYSGSRVNHKAAIAERVAGMIEDGADIIDVGGCSTRPGFSLPTEEEEWERVDMGCETIRGISSEIPISVDTFRASVASKAIDKWDIEIINDISGGEQPEIWELASARNIPYVLTHNRHDGDTSYKDVTAEVITELSLKLNELHRLGVNDVIIDPGFGFAKNLSQNFQLLEELNEIARMGYPVLVGLSRKSMIYKTIEGEPENALTGTVALDAIALEKGAHILRVHDVKEAKETVKLFSVMKNLTI